jgi:hypothetical protein
LVSFLSSFHHRSSPYSYGEDHLFLLFFFLPATDFEHVRQQSRFLDIARLRLFSCTVGETKGTVPIPSGWWAKGTLAFPNTPGWNFGKRVSRVRYSIACTSQKETPLD